MPTSFSQARGFSGSRVSILTATTSKSAPPSFACNSSSAGISLRQGTHQVAHRLNSTVRPRQSDSRRSAPLPSRKARSGSRIGRLAAVMAATSPRANGAIRRAVSTAGRQAGRSAALPSNRLIPYTPASPTATPAMPPARISDKPPFGGALRCIAVAGHRRRNLGGRVMSNKMWGGRFADSPDAIMEEINASIDFDRHLYRQDIAASKAHAAMLGKQGIITADDAARDRSRSRHDPVRDRGRQVHLQAARSKTST